MNDSLTRWGYCLIRWVPEPARGEFVNIGAVTFNDRDDDEVRLRLSRFQRANRLGQTPPELGEMVLNLVTPLYRATPPRRFEVAVQMSHDHQNLLQFTSPMPMAVSSAQEAMKMVFDTLVGEE